jgi:putative ABC transport system permease protein
MNSFVRLVHRDLNFVAEGLVRLDFNVPAARYAKPIGSYGEYPYFEISPSPVGTMARVLERLRAIPGAQSVGGISAPPVDAFVLSTVDVILPAHAVSSTSSATYFIVTPNLFPTLRTPIVRGRDFTERDAAGVPWIAIVNETAARRLWPGEDPIGKRLRLDIVPEEQPREVVGVVGDIPTRHDEDVQPVVYASFLQQPSRYRAPWMGMPGTMTFLLRAAGDPAALIPAARQAVAEVEPGRPLTDVSTVDSHTSNAMAKFRYFVLLVGVFAAAATLLAAVGTYGVMAYAVSQRTREIGIRRALGAGPRQIVAMVGRRAITFVGVGLVSGLAGALALTHLIASQLWGVTPTDPATYAGVSVLLVGVALVACVGPVRRAIAVDPTIALRSE